MIKKTFLCHRLKAREYLAFEKLTLNNIQEKLIQLKEHDSYYA